MITEQPLLKVSGKGVAKVIVCGVAKSTGSKSIVGAPPKPAPDVAARTPPKSTVWFFWPPPFELLG